MVTVEEITLAIMKKRELQKLDVEFVRAKVESILGGNNKIVKKMEASRDFQQFSKSKEYKDLLKTVRKELRAVYGVFQEGNPDEFLKKMKTETDEFKRRSLLWSLLETHTSTKERLPYYDIMYKELSDRIPKPSTLLDIGCGLNPLSSYWMQRHGWNPKITATDISSGDMDFLVKAFGELGIDGEAFRLDVVSDYEKLSEYKVDVAFLLKVLDSFEESQRHISYKIMENIRAKHIIVSFPTKSLGGKNTISRKGRTWFERLLKRKELSYFTFQVPNELFYVISGKSE